MRGVFRVRWPARRWGSVALLALAACGGGSEGSRDGAIVCTTEARAGITIRVFDTATGSPISCGATAVLTDGAYSENVQHWMNASPSCDNTIALAGAYERAGTYNVIVSKTGYASATFTGVIVAADICHVNTVTLDANLVRSGP